MTQQPLPPSPPPALDTTPREATGVEPPKAPPTSPGEGLIARYGTAEADATGGVIPYNNPCALIAYYLGLFSMIPLFGFFLGIVAFILGILGLKAREKNPRIRGSVHAWIGIILGGLMAVVWLIAGPVLISLL